MQLLTDYFGISNKDLYKNLYDEFYNTYSDIDLNQIVDDYCYENHLDSCYTLDAIEHNVRIRTLFESMVNGILQKYHLDDLSTNNSKRKTIFDTAA